MQATIKLQSGYEIVASEDYHGPSAVSTDSVTIFQKDTGVPLVKVYIADGRIIVRWNETVVHDPVHKFNDNTIELPFEP